MCLFKTLKVRDDADDDLQAMIGIPTYQVRGAEIFISIDEQANIRLLTNRGSLNLTHEKDFFPDQTRLTYPSFVE